MFRCLLALAAAISLGSAASAELRPVNDSDTLVNALSDASAGDTIELAPGEYRLNGRVNLRASGTEEAPITVRSAVPGTAQVSSRSDTVIKLFGANWHLEGLDFRGGESDNHALHIVGEAHHVRIRGNRFRNYHSAIKVNGEGNPRIFPDQGAITGNVFVNDTIRDTRWPVVAIDIVGGQGWRIDKNFIADMAQARQGRHGSPGFAKGGATEAVFDRNLVICQWRHRGGPRIGLSLGGGGTAPSVMDPRGAGEDCEEDCPETVDSRMTNNIILNCPDEPGLYLNRAHRALVANNTIYDAYGIQARFPQTSAQVTDNLLTGTVWARDGADVQAEANRATGWFDSAAYIPGLRDRVTARIERYHRDYPRWVRESPARWLVQTVESVSEWARRGWPGQRHAPFEEWFLAPDAGDLRLLGFDADMLGAGSAPPVVGHDFCGQPREGTADTGAIQYSAGECVVVEELRERHGELFESLRREAARGNR